jgi:hypothetical protein
MMIPQAMQGWPAIPVPLMNGFGAADGQAAPEAEVGGDGGNAQPQNPQTEVSKV